MPCRVAASPANVQTCRKIKNGLLNLPWIRAPPPPPPPLSTIASDCHGCEMNPLNISFVFNQQYTRLKTVLLFSTKFQCEDIDELSFIFNDRLTKRRQTALRIDQMELSIRRNTQTAIGPLLPSNSLSTTFNDSDSTGQKSDSILEIGTVSTVSRATYNILVEHRQ